MPNVYIVRDGECDVGSPSCNASGGPWRLHHKVSPAGLDHARSLHELLKCVDFRVVRTVFSRRAVQTAEIILNKGDVPVLQSGMFGPDLDKMTHWGAALGDGCMNVDAEALAALCVHHQYLLIHHQRRMVPELHTLVRSLPPHSSMLLVLCEPLIWVLLQGLRGLPLEAEGASLLPYHSYHAARIEDDAYVEHRTVVPGMVSA